ncbi:MAG: hypothetical protein HWN79_12045 [Candidatus Lokiarchaeota archaeon]|nr:hypothetical protein [Candidatus Lokiarchaeota archaeon]
MDFDFELTSYDVVESRDSLLQIVQKICESEVVAAVGSYHFWFDSIVLRSPNRKKWRK